MDLSGPPDDLLPEDAEMGLVAATAQQLNRHWQVLWDLRELGTTVYRDTVEALQAVARHYDAGNIGGALTVLIPPGRAEEVRSALRPLSVTPVEMLPKQVPRQEVELDAFDWDTVFSHPMIDRAVQMGSVSPDLIVRALAGEEVEWNPVAQDLAKQAWLGELAEEDPYQAATVTQRIIALDRSLRAATTHSVLTQLTLHAEGGRVHLIPYHGGGLHEALGAGDQAVLLRPARVNRRYWATFDAAIAKLEALLNKRGVKEREIEAVLEENPLFLNSLGFERIYHQVILPRNGASDLKPDVVAEPADSEWAEILDLKLPTTSVLVGPPNRAAMSAALTEAAAQLREYAAFFDDRAAARSVEQNLGIKCYRPKLTVIIGRDPTRFTEEERRRALTAHPDLRVVTYDDLVTAARTRLLL